MMRSTVRLIGFASAAFGAALGLFTTSGCATENAAAPAERQTAEPEVDRPATAAVSGASTNAAAPAAAPPVGVTTRVGGDRDATATWSGDAFRSGTSRIDTPLPEGYPAPTPPGAIDIKSYPVVRRAEVSGTMWPELGMNMAFFPLFNHIKRREIAMTSPVEMDYRGMSPTTAKDGPEGWTMSFLYREVDQGPSGVDERDSRVRVADTRPVTVVATGLRGSYGMARVREGLDLLAEWFESNPQWQPAGDARALYYNGPDMPARHRWMEVQVPIKPAE